MNITKMKSNLVKAAAAVVAEVEMNGYTKEGLRLLDLQLDCQENLENAGVLNHHLFCGTPYMPAS